MSKIFVTGAGVVPVLGKLLSDFAEGEIVKLNENGSPVEFYVAKHNYEETLNGTGRTLLVRKESTGATVHWNYNVDWNNNSQYKNIYADGYLDTWLNNSYKSMLDQNVQSTMETTTFYYTQNNGDGVASTYVVKPLTRSVFVLSIAELGMEYNTFGDAVREEGSKLPTADNIINLYRNGAFVQRWLRTPRITHQQYAYYIQKENSISISGISSKYEVQPAFTLPDTALFDEETLLFRRVK